MEPVALSNQTISSAPGLKMSYLCGQFVDGYKSIYLNNFFEFYGQYCDSEIAEDELSSYASNLYSAMFGEQENDSSVSLYDVFDDFVRRTVDAEPILLKTWMRMVNDFVDVLEARQGFTHHLTEFVSLIEDLSNILYDVYFRTSQTYSPAATATSAKQIAQNDDFALFKQAFDCNDDTARNISLFNFYKGMPVKFDAQILNIDESGVFCKVAPRQSAVLAHQKVTIIEDAVRQEDFTADVLEINLQQNIAHLSNLNILAGQRERRQEIRVEPSCPTTTHIEHSNGDTIGRLVDISTKTAAIYIRNDGLDLKDTLTIQMQLNCDTHNKTVTIETTGRIIRIRADSRDDARAHIVVIQLDTDTQTESQIAAYVSTRQSEVLKEIRRFMEAAQASA